MSLSTPTFIQLRHNYAPEKSDGHIHLSAPLITAMARLHAAGMTHFRYDDENFGDAANEKIEADIVGINLVGAPYIPKAIELIRHHVRDGATVLLGGQIVDSLGSDLGRLIEEFRGRFTILNGNSPENLKKVFGLTHIPTEEEVSSIPIWDQIDEDQMESYLSHEISFYLSQGCKHKCTFCQAKKNTPERYRDLAQSSRDLEWLTQRALSFGLDHLDIYLSNLDLFQTPAELKRFADAVIYLKKKHGFTYNMRGLSTVDSILEASPSVIEKMREAGICTVGFGIDGATAEEWRSTGKIQNLSDNNEADAQKCIDAIRTTHEHGLTPEILMVFGHDVGDFTKSKHALEMALKFSQEMMATYGAIPRPHVVKNLVPGAKDWKKRKTNAELIELLLDHPEFFQALDYTALPSEFTHPDPEFRALVEHYYRAVCSLSPKSTRLIYPDTPEFRARAAQMDTTIKKLNEGQFDR